MYFFRTIFGAVTHEGGPGFTNMARCDPSKVTVGAGTGTRVFTTVGCNTPINFVAFIKVKSSNLVKPQGPAGSNSNYTKRVDCFMLAGEFSRAICLPGMVLNISNYSAPVGFGYCTFGGDWKPMPPTGGHLTLCGICILLMTVYVQLQPPPIQMFPLASVGPAASKTQALLRRKEITVMLACRRNLRRTVRLLLAISTAYSPFRFQSPSTMELV